MVVNGALCSFTASRRRRSSERNDSAETIYTRHIHVQHVMTVFIVSSGRLIDIGCRLEYYMENSKMGSTDRMGGRVVRGNVNGILHT
jgi:hypothetical protein